MSLLRMFVLKEVVLMALAKSSVRLCLETNANSIPNASTLRLLKETDLLENALTANALEKLLVRFALPLTSAMLEASALLELAKLLDLLLPPALLTTSVTLC